MPKSGVATKTDWARLIIPAALYVALAITAWKLGWLSPANVEKESRAHSIAGIPLFTIGYVGLYAIVAASALPVGPLAYGAGALFGFVRGAIYVFIGSMLGAAAGYFLARVFLGAATRRILGSHRQQVQDFAKGNVVLNSFRMQLIPIIPFGIRNYAAGISKVSPAKFLAGTAAGIIPATLVAAFVGDRFMAGVTGHSKKPLFLGLGIVAALMALTFVPALVRKLEHK
jgi:uncharacterized membrane protein YdjX (TVP38/TMEM64 family)